MTTIVMTVHGHGFVPQEPDAGKLRLVDGQPYTDVTGMPVGWGKIFSIASGRGTWFHLSVPSVEAIAGGARFLDEFSVFFVTEIQEGRFTTQISKVDAWNGATRILDFRPPNPYAGDWSTKRVVTNSQGVTYGNTWRPRHPETHRRFQITSGLGISLEAGALLEGSITFIGAAATFIDRAI